MLYILMRTITMNTNSNASKSSGLSIIAKPLKSIQNDSKFTYIVP